MDSELQQLKQAVQLSPDNVPLRMLYASALVKSKHWNEAESEYMTVLNSDPDSVEAKSRLSELYYTMGKYSQAAVILEDLVQAGNDGPDLLIVYAWILYKEGDLEKARSVYTRAVSLDKTIADTELESQLKMKPGNPAEEGVFKDRVSVQDDKQGPVLDLQKPDLNFAGVGGMDTLKDEIRMKVIYPALNPELFKAYGKKAGGGILLYGPPGCGKTYIARATAGEVKSNFISVGLHDILDMWIGESEKNLHQVFDFARMNKPSVLFFDEIDALAAKRTDMKHSAGRHTINQFLSELDGVEGNNTDILILGATNAPWHLDEAFKRPGRFDRVIFVPPPDKKARAEILALHLEGKPASQIDCEEVAKKTEEFSGADMRLLVDTAVEDKLSEAMKTGKVIPITTKDLLKAASTIKPTTKEWFATAKNYAVYSNESGVYDDIKKYMGLK